MNLKVQRHQRENAHALEGTTMVVEVERMLSKMECHNSSHLQIKVNRVLTWVHKEAWVCRACPLKTLRLIQTATVQAHLETLLITGASSPLKFACANTTRLEQ